MQVYPDASKGERSSKADEHADSDRRSGRYLDPSPDFFDAERHPELRFAAQDIRLDGDGQVSLDGELMIRGVTKPVTVTGTVTAPIADPYGNDRIGLNLAAKIDRTDFGVDWNNPLPSGEPALANDVTILAELQFVKPAGETS